MLNLLKITVAVVVVFSLAYIVISFATFSKWNPPDYKCAILNESIVLQAEGSEVIMGVLEKGTVLFAPTKHDMSITDPNNVYMHKVYIQVPSEVFDRLIFLPPKRSIDVDVPRTIHRILNGTSRLTHTNKISVVSNLFNECLSIDLRDTN